MDYQYVNVKVQDSVGTILLNDPKKRNAFSAGLTADLKSALEALRYDPACRVIVLRGAGGNFCGGGDITAMVEKRERLQKGLPLAEDPRVNLDRLVSIITCLRDCEKPTIAWLEGAVAGAGLSIAMACDFSLAEETCKMLFAFVKIGLVPDMGATFLLTRRVGAALATELFMTARPSPDRTPPAGASSPAPCLQRNWRPPWQTRPKPLPQAPALPTRRSKS